jgi:hypothetical protein
MGMYHIKKKINVVMYTAACGARLHMAVRSNVVMYTAACGARLHMAVRSNASHTVTVRIIYFILGKKFILIFCT